MHPSHLAPRDPGQAHRRRLGAGVGALAVIALLLLALRPGPDSDPPPAAGSTISADPAPTTSPATSPAPSSTPSSSPSPSSTDVTLPAYETTGEFRAAPGTDTVRGDSGHLMTYRVEVEKGSGVSPEEFADAIDRTLRHPRGWTAGGNWRFQRVGGDEARTVIRLATPDSVDEQCAAAGANTDGYTSCRAGRYVLINLDRWYIGVPHIRDLDLYRSYLVNHEVGHALGKEHQACPGKGEAAPVMLQQTLDLDGCVANAWPRDAKGRLITGPPTR